MKESDLTIEQLNTFSIIERVCSVFSLLGCLLTISTFCISKSFHKPINRLVFYATFGNTMSNVATLISRAFLGDTNSAGCQFQAFLVQMCVESYDAARLLLADMALGSWQQTPSGLFPCLSTST